MDQRPEQPPEGKLIADAADRLDLSIREAARRAGISYGRWRQIVMGYQNISPGVFAPVHAPAKTVAKMASVVSVRPAELTAAGREDAARVLEEIQRREPPRAPSLLAPVPDAPGLEDYVGQVRADLGRAMARYGPGFTPEQAYTHVTEAATWADLDGSMPDPERHVRLIARFRRLRDAMETAERDARAQLTLL